MPSRSIVIPWLGSTAPSASSSNSAFLRLTDTSVQGRIFVSILIGTESPPSTHTTSEGVSIIAKSPVTLTSSAGRSVWAVFSRDFYYSNLSNLRL